VLSTLCECVVGESWFESLRTKQDPRFIFRDFRRNSEEFIEVLRNKKNPKQKELKGKSSLE
jgi:hypothetical protein